MEHTLTMLQTDKKTAHSNARRERGTPPTLLPTHPPPPPPPQETKIGLPLVEKIVPHHSCCPLVENV